MIFHFICLLNITDFSIFYYLNFFSCVEPSTEKIHNMFVVVVHSEEGPDLQTGEGGDDLEHGQVQRLHQSKRCLKEGFGRKLGVPHHDRKLCHA